MSAVADDRMTAINDWLAAQLPDASFRLTPASSDASFRRYFRVHFDRACARFEDKTLIVMDAPPVREDCRPFVDVATRLEAAGLNIPSVLAEDMEQGFLLLRDLGNRTYLDELNAETVPALYADALTALVQMQRRADMTGLANYDRELLLTEMGLFRDWLCDKHLGLDWPTELDGCFDWLADNALSQPKVFVHRDYHSRNLMICDQDNPGVLDFQDAVQGPVTYDLVSLLRDCYIAWPRAQVEQWVADVHARGGHDVPFETFLRWFDLMGVQRHLKASGIFCRLLHRDGKDGYLKDVPRTLQYIVEVAPAYPELSGLAELISSKVLPAL